jgi:DNA-binding MarR family transcriptional regulator
LTVGSFDRRADRVKDDDRRAHALHLTQKGRAALARVGQVARDHQAALCASLTERERRQLARFLQRIADEQGLTRGVHPGYSRLAQKARR